MDYNTNKVIALPKNARFITKKSCGNIDQPFVDLIGQSTRVEPLVNDTSILLNFYDSNNQKTFAITRKYAKGEAQKIIKLNPATTNQPTTTPNNNKQSTTQGISSTQSNYQQNPSGNQQGITQNPANGPGSIQPQAPPPPPSASTSALRSLPLSEVKKLLVGVYNPTKVYTAPLPVFMSKNIKFTFTLNSVSITGLCYSYKYPMKIT